MSLYFVPFDLVNPSARVLLVGLTPGRHQMHLAVITAAAALRAGRSIDQALRAAKQAAGFAGTMRTNLVARRAMALTGVDPRRVLADFPHPSGANGHRVRQYERAREAMGQTVAAWFG